MIIQVRKIEDARRLIEITIRGIDNVWQPERQIDNKVGEFVTFGQTTIEDVSFVKK